MAVSGASKTQLSLMATPGKRHAIVAKAAAAVVGIVGYLTVTWSAKAPGFEFDSKAPKITFVPKAPGFEFTSE